MSDGTTQHTDYSNTSENDQTTSNPADTTSEQKMQSSLFKKRKLTVRLYLIPNQQTILLTLDKAVS